MAWPSALTVAGRVWRQLEADGEVRRVLFKLLATVLLGCGLGLWLCRALCRCCCGVDDGGGSGGEGSREEVDRGGKRKGEPSPGGGDLADTLLSSLLAPYDGDGDGMLSCEELGLLVADLGLALPCGGGRGGGGRPESWVRRCVAVLGVGTAAQPPRRDDSCVGAQHLRTLLGNGGDGDSGSDEDQGERRGAGAGGNAEDAARFQTRRRVARRLQQASLLAETVPRLPAEAADGEQTDGSGGGVSYVRAKLLGGGLHGTVWSGGTAVRPLAGGGGEAGGVRCISVGRAMSRSMPRQLRTAQSADARPIEQLAC
eukprot:COSAG01_NODE_5564_length_4180_cov_3.259740_5_plen_313_part_00